MKSFRFLSAFSILFALLAALFACSSAPSAPEFSLENIRGGKVDSAKLKGKVVVVDFWATWCDPCITEIPKYRKLREKMAGKDVEILAVTMDSGKIDKVRSEVAALDMPYTVVMGTDKVEDGFGGLVGYPTTYVVDQKWKIYKKYPGAGGNKIEKIEKDIATLLAPPQ